MNCSMQAGSCPTSVHTSVLRRAIRTADLALEAAGRAWVLRVPVVASQRTPLRSASGKSMKGTRPSKFGDEARFRLWRRSETTCPAATSLEPGSELAAMRETHATQASRPMPCPSTECLKRRAFGRVFPYWYAISSSSPTFPCAGKTVLVSAHAATRCALSSSIWTMSPSRRSPSSTVPTGVVPLLYELDAEMRPLAAASIRVSASAGATSIPKRATASIEGRPAIKAASRAAWKVCRLGAFAPRPEHSSSMRQTGRNCNRNCDDPLCEIDEAIGIAPLVVVPRDDLHLWMPSITVVSSASKIDEYGGSRRCPRRRARLLAVGGGCRQARPGICAARDDAVHFLDARRARDLDGRGRPAIRSRNRDANGEALAACPRARRGSPSPTALGGAGRRSGRGCSSRGGAAPCG